MEFRYSSILDTSSYDGLREICGDLEVRTHNDVDVANLAAIRVHEDWEENVGPLKNFTGGLSPHVNVICLTMPECLPERLDLIAYATEFTLITDDIWDAGKQEEASAAVSDVLGAFNDVIQEGPSEAMISGKRRLQSALILRMLAVDRVRGLRIVKLWKEGLQRSVEVKASFVNVDGYLEYRLDDFGVWAWSGFVLFGCALTITEEEERLSRDLCRPAYAALCLINDLFSWDKEHRSALQRGEPSVSNAIWVIMREKSVSLDEAKQICRRLIREYVDAHVGVIQRVKQERAYSDELIRYLEMTSYAVVGSALWSMTCPRYNPGTQLNAQQIDWVTNGIPDHLRRLGGERVKAPVMPSIDQGRVSKAKETKDEKVKSGASTSGQGTWLSNSMSGSCASSDAPATPSSCSSIDSVLLCRDLPALSQEIIDGPSQYIASMPGKGVRSSVIDALNVWYASPASSVSIIKRVIDLLHQASLMLDDIQDDSPLRRGKPSTHTVFGVPQTINSSSYKICEALQEVLKLGNMDCVRIVIEESQQLYVGQSYDLHWTANLICPEVEEYIRVLDDKTGGLIRMLTRLLDATSPLSRKPNLHSLVTILGRAYALRDDYANLSSSEYAEKKGWCEDLDEGKYSLPLIHSLQTLPRPRALVLQNMLTQRRVNGKSCAEHKHAILGMLEEAGSLRFTLDALRLLQDEVMCELEGVERETGIANLELRAVIEMVRI